MYHGSASSILPPGPGGGAPPQHWMVYENAFSIEECGQLLELFARLDAVDGGLVAGRFDNDVRQSSLVWLPEDESLDWAHGRMARLASNANRDLFEYALEGFEEQLQIAAYGPGHFYDWHIDRGQGATAGRRKLTLSVQLSDPGDYVGGELEINADGRPFQAPAARGTAVAFSAQTLHRVAPVVSGRRHSLVAWVHGPRFV